MVGLVSTTAKFADTLAILADMLVNSTFPPEALERPKPEAPEGVQPGTPPAPATADAPAPGTKPAAAMTPAGDGGKGPPPAPAVRGKIVEVN